MTALRDIKPNESYDLLRKQFYALRSICIAQEETLTYLKGKDYALAESRLKVLEEALESEKSMNSILTAELEREVL